MSQAPHVPTLETRAKVNALASFGIPKAKIAKYIGVSAPTLDKYYPEELDKALIDKIVAVANALYNNAVDKNNVSAQIFFLKTQAGWREIERNDDDSDESISKIEIEVIEKK